MTHLPYIIAAYSLGVLIPAWFGVASFVRMRAVARRLAVLDPRARRAGAGGR